MVCDADQCFHTNEAGEPNYFEFTIESDGRIPPHIIFMNSITVLEEKLNNFIKSLDDTKKISFDKGDCIMPSYDINITDEDYTLGYLLQHYMYTLFYLPEDKKINYISSTILHPLINKLLIRIALKETGMKEDYIKSLFKECIIEIKKDLNNIKNDFKSNKQLSF